MCVHTTDVPAYSDIGYSDTPLIVTLLAGPKSIITVKYPPLTVTPCLEWHFSLVRRVSLRAETYVCQSTGLFHRRPISHEVILFLYLPWTRWKSHSRFGRSDISGRPQHAAHLCMRLYQTWLDVKGQLDAMLPSTKNKVSSVAGKM